MQRVVHGRVRVLGATGVRAASVPAPAAAAAPPPRTAAALGPSLMEPVATTIRPAQLFARAGYEYNKGSESSGSSGRWLQLAGGDTCPLAPPLWCAQTGLRRLGRGQRSACGAIKLFWAFEIPSPVNKYLNTGSVFASTPLLRVTDNVRPYVDHDFPFGGMESYGHRAHS